MSNTTPDPVTDELALAFHRATGDGAIGQEDVDCIKEGLRAVLAQLASDAHEPNAKLMALADRIDPDELWRRPVLERLTMPQHQQDALDAGVNLRRYADLLGEGCWRIFPPRPGVCFRASTLENAAAMARRDEHFRSARS